MHQTVKSNLCLLLTAAIWGSAFVAQRTGMDSMGPVFFVALRSFLSSAVLLLIAGICDRTGRTLGPVADGPRDAEESCDAEAQREGAAGAGAGPDPAAGPETSAGRASRGAGRTLLRGGLACGLVICLASNFQQIGLVSIDAGKCGFLTALYIVLVPLIGILLRQPVHANHLAAALLGTAGLYFLCISGSFSMEFGDLMALVGALFWACHILVVAHFAPKLDPVKLSAAQFLVCGVVSLLCAPLLGETLSLSMILEARYALLYTGVLSSAVGFTLQIVAQRHANPTAASLIMSMEALFAVIAGFLFLGERFTSREAIGAVLMMAAVIIAQFSLRELRGLLTRRRG